MSTMSIPEVLRELYTAPLDAAVRAEAEYRRIWGEWLQLKKQLLGDPLPDGVTWAQVLETAPVVTLDGRVDVAVSMRIATAKEITAGGEVGIGVGPIQFSGSFGFMSRTTQESTFQAATVVVLSNNRKSLPDYLAEHGIKPTDPKVLTKAAKLLSKGGPPATALEGGGETVTKKKKKKTG